MIKEIGRNTYFLLHKSILVEVILKNKFDKTSKIHILTLTSVF